MGNELPLRHGFGEGGVAGMEARLTMILPVQFFWAWQASTISSRTELILPSSRPVAICFRPAVPQCQVSQVEYGG